MKLADSKIFPGDDKTLEPEKEGRCAPSAKIFVYVPGGVTKDGTPRRRFSSSTMAPAR
jgi:hypothetical protein